MKRAYLFAFGIGALVVSVVWIAAAGAVSASWLQEVRSWPTSRQIMLGLALACLGPLIPAVTGLVKRRRSKDKHGEQVML